MFTPNTTTCKVTQRLCAAAEIHKQAVSVASELFLTEGTMAAHVQQAEALAQHTEDALIAELTPAVLMQHPGAVQAAFETLFNPAETDERLYLCTPFGERFTQTVLEGNPMFDFTFALAQVQEADEFKDIRAACSAYFLKEADETRGGKRAHPAQALKPFHPPCRISFNQLQLSAKLGLLCL